MKPAGQKPSSPSLPVIGHDCRFCNLWHWHLQKNLELCPGQKIITASRFSETNRVKGLQNLGAGAYIRKPFLLEKIGLMVKEELEKSGQFLIHSSAEDFLYYRTYKNHDIRVVDMAKLDLESPVIKNIPMSQKPQYLDVSDMAK